MDSSSLRSAPELTGRIEGATLAGLLQMLEQTRRTGALTLQGQTGPYTLIWKDGELAAEDHARLLESLVCVMAERKLAFEFAACDVDAERTAPLTGTLLDALRTLDEWVTALWGLPPLDTVFEAFVVPEEDAGLVALASVVDGASTLIAAALALGVSAAEVGELLRRAQSRGLLKAFDPTTSSGSILAPPPDLHDAPLPSRSSLGSEPSDPSRVSLAAMQPGGGVGDVRGRASSSGTLRAGSAAPWSSWAALVAWVRRLFGAADTTASAATEAPSASAAAAARRPSNVAIAAGRGTPWERHDCALGDDAAEVASRLPKALAAEHKQVRDAGDREFLERLVASCTRALDLPMFPDAARRLDQLVRKGDPDLRDVVDVVRSDPDLARRVMQVASTSAQGRTPRDLDRAVARLGLDHLLRVAVSVFLQAPIFKVPGHEGEARTARRAAVLAGEIASSRVGASQDAASHYLAALLHEVGRLQILRLAVVRPSRAVPSAALVADIAFRYQTSVATLMVGRWGLGREIEAAVARHPAPRPGRDEGARRVRAAQVAAHAALATGFDEAQFERVIAEIEGGDPKALLTQARTSARSAMALGI